jgi:hypothetical protein
MLRSTIVLLLFFFSCFTCIKAQDTSAAYTKEFTITTENDNYNVLFFCNLVTAC